MERLKMIDALVDKAGEDESVWLDLEEEVMGQTRLDWLASELELLPVHELERLYEKHC